MNDNKGKRALFIGGVLGVAIAAGAAAGSMVASSMLGSVGAVSVATVVGATRQPVKVDDTKVSASRRAMVVFYHKKTGTGPLDKVILPTDAVGAGVVVTSDGWLATDATVFASTEPLLAVFNDRLSAYIDPTKAVKDEATGIAFIKAPVAKLEVAAFGDDTVLRPGDQVFGVDSFNVTTTNVVATRYLPAETKFDYVESTERLGRRLLIAVPGTRGMAVVNGNGEVVGLSRGNGLVVPETYIVQTLRSLFGGGKIIRPTLGVHYVSLDNLPNMKETGLASTGALVTGGGKFRATEKGSAGEAAGLLEGDVIIAVERDRINSDVTFGERLEDYAPGAKIELTVLRGKETIKLPVVIK